MVCSSYVRRCEHNHDGQHEHWCNLRWSFCYWPGKWNVYDFLTAIYPGQLKRDFVSSRTKRNADWHKTHQESIPARYRGLMISSFQVWTSVGSLVGTIVDNFTSKILTRESYLIPLGLVFVIPTFMSVGLLFIPESPRWLLEHGDREKALKSLLWLRPYGQEGAEEEAKDIQEALENENMIKQSAGVLDMFRTPSDRRRTILAICAISLQGASGAMYMIGKTLPSLSSVISVLIRK